jgi:hypothetical protein
MPMLKTYSKKSLGQDEKIAPSSFSLQNILNYSKATKATPSAKNKIIYNCN